MPNDPLRLRRARSRIRDWLPANPSGVPRRQAFARALLGIGLGIGSGAVIWTLAARFPPRSIGVAWLDIVLGSVSGAIVGPLGVVLLARLLDRTVQTADRLVGYSGLIRMLLHAGELSFLGALAGGVGGGAGGTSAGIISGAIITGLAGAALYHLRGLGLLLGLTLGIIIGAIAGAVGGSLPYLAP